MIRKLQKKFILITMGSLVLVMILLIGVINAINVYQMNRKVDIVMNLLSANDGKFPEYEKDKTGGGKIENGLNFTITEETQYETRYFMVRTDGDGNLIDSDVSHIAAVSETQAEQYMEDISQTEVSNGYMGIYKYRVIEKPYGSLTIFVDCRSQIQMATLYMVISVALGVSCLLLVFILIFLFSKKAVGPIIESIEKQKQFITDAGHEIKTPLAIISADAEVLELTGGENEWTKSIRNQTQRLDKLVKNLLALSKMDEENIEMVFADFPVSEAVTEAAEPFVAVAEMQKKHFEMNIQKGLFLHGEQGSIRQLVSILVDNAVKYAQEEGRIRVSLSSSGRALKLEVCNTGIDLPKGNLEKLFDRFYRSDSSRSRDTGGYGIGLSIAQNIVRAHKGKISASVENEKEIRFIATFIKYTQTIKDLQK